MTLRKRRSVSSFRAPCEDERREHAEPRPKDQGEHDPLHDAHEFVQSAADSSVQVSFGASEVGMADEDTMKELERLRAENEALKKRSSKGVSIKVSEKGGVSIYGLGRF